MVDLGPFPLGMNNRARSHSLPPGSVRNLVNSDCDKEGFLRRRQGLTKVTTCIEGRESFNCPSGSYYRDGQSLYKFNGTAAPSLLISGLTGVNCSFEYFNGVVYFSDGVINRKIMPDGSMRIWGIKQPAVPVMFSGNGNLAPGQYLGAVTFVDQEGKDSAASDIMVINCNDTGQGHSIVFFNIPNPMDPQVKAVRVFLSKPNGKTLYLVDELLTGDPRLEISDAAYDDDRALETEHLSAPPPGVLLCQHGSRMYMADEYGGLWFTEPFNMDLCNLADNYRQYPEPITVLLSVPGGLYVVSEKVRFIPGSNPMESGEGEILELPGIFGTGFHDKKTKNVGWFSPEGMVMASPDGAILSVGSENAAVDTGDAGATIVTERDGVRQVIASIKNASVSKLAATSFIEAEIIRRN